jgi:DNA repair protein RadA/Sms
MPKAPKVVYSCTECGAETPQWYGKCPFCGTYNSLVEETKGNSNGRGKGNGKERSKAPGMRSSLTFDEIVDTAETRWESGFGELDRVLGGGIVPGSLVLIGGDPGIGKSTLLLQTANCMSVVKSLASK